MTAQSSPVRLRNVQRIRCYNGWRWWRSPFWAHFCQQKIPWRHHCCGFSRRRFLFAASQFRCSARQKRRQNSDDNLTKRNDMKWHDLLFMSTFQAPLLSSFNRTARLPLVQYFFESSFDACKHCKSIAKRLDDAIAVWQGSMVIWYRSQVGTTNHCNVCSAALLQHCVE